MNPAAIIVRFRSAWLGAALLLLSLVLAGRSAGAESALAFRVIVHPENPSSSLSREFVADAYLKRVTRWPDGQPLHPVDQHSGAALRQRFSDVVLKRSLTAVKRYWQQRIFSGRELPPPELDSDDAVVSYVLKHRGAIGYVSEPTKLQGAKTVTVR